MWKRIGYILLALCFAVAMYYSLRKPLTETSGGDNLYVYQADAFIHGMLDISGDFWDSIVIQGKRYVPFPPGPAILLIPFVALLGTTLANTVYISLGLTAGSILFMWRFLTNLGANASTRRWISIAFFLGTGYWGCLNQSNSVWFFAHIVSVFFLLGALQLSSGPRAAVLSGLFLGFSLLSRQATLFALPVIAYLLVRDSSDRGQIARRLLGLLAGFIPCCLFYLWFNWARFGNPLDTGYELIEVNGFLANRVAAFGLSSPAYIPFNLFYLVLEGFHISFQDASRLGGLSLDPMGTSLLMASPFILLAFFAPWKGKFTRFAWLSILPMVMIHLSYYNNGWVQTNMQRFALDYLPIWMGLAALGFEKTIDGEMGRFWKISILYAIFLNSISALLVPLEHQMSIWQSWFRKTPPSH
jgi:hypothetical protein